MRNPNEKDKGVAYKKGITACPLGSNIAFIKHSDGNECLILFKN